MKAMAMAALGVALAACGGSESDVFGSDARKTSESGTGGAAGSGSGGAAATGRAGASSKACVPGKQEACACPGGTLGAQACFADGSGYGACECPDGGAGGASGSTSSSGETTTSSSSATGGVWCIADYGCEWDQNNVPCIGSWGSGKGYPLSVLKCNTMPPCCIDNGINQGIKQYCCAQ